MPLQLGEGHVGHLGVQQSGGSRAPEFTGSRPGLVPDKPDTISNSWFLRADGNWAEAAGGAGADGAPGATTISGLTDGPTTNPAGTPGQVLSSLGTNGTNTQKWEWVNAASVYTGGSAAGLVPQRDVLSSGATTTTKYLREDGDWIDLTTPMGNSHRP